MKISIHLIFNADIRFKLELKKKFSLKKEANFVSTENQK